MLKELQNVLSQQLYCLCTKTTSVLSEWIVPKTVDMNFLRFHCITNKYCIEVYVCMYTVRTVHTVQVHMSTSIITHYIGRDCQSPNPQEMHCSSSSSSCSWRVRSVILFLNPQDEVGSSISSLVVPCSFALSVYTVMLVLVVCLCPSSVRAVATFSGIVLFPLLSSVLLFFP